MIEVERLLALQRQLDGQRTASERNRLGQFATPPELAAAVVRLGLSWLDDPAPIRFFDPALGLGMFYAALQQSGRPLGDAQGVERDPRFVEAARALWPELEVIEGDFTRQAPRSQATLLVCNPPYVRHHHLSKEDKYRIIQEISRREGVLISGLAGLYSAFLLLSRGFMAEGGVGLWLVPSEVLDVGYAGVVRRFLSERVTLLQVHRIHASDLQFSDALVSSAVLVLRNAPPPAGHRVRLSWGGLPDAPQGQREIGLDALSRAERWGPLAREAPPEVRAGTPLGALFEIRRGVATGANAFFVLRRSKAAALGLPAEQLRPFLPGPRGLATDEILADADGWPRLPDPLALIACDLDEPTLSARHPALWRYLEAGRETVGARYLCRHRRPWYAQERRAPAPLLCSYMGRGARPFRFVLNRSRALAPNVWLGLYPRPALAAQIQQRPELLRAIRDELQALTLDDLQQEARVYGGGLYKLEPRELGRLRLLTATSPPPSSAPPAPGAGPRGARRAG